MVSELVQRLTQIQRAETLTDAAFARRIDVNVTTWCLVRLGCREPSKRVIEGAFRQWPELAVVYALSLRTPTEAVS